MLIKLLFAQVRSATHTPFAILSFLLFVSFVTQIVSAILLLHRKPVLCKRNLPMLWWGKKIKKENSQNCKKLRQ